MFTDGDIVCILFARTEIAQWFTKWSEGPIQVHDCVSDLPPQIWFYTNDIFENAGIPPPEIQYTTAGTGIIEIIAGLIGVKFIMFICGSEAHKKV